MLDFSGSGSRSGHTGSGSGLILEQWKWKLIEFKVVEAEAEAASFKKLEGESLHAEAIKNTLLPHHWGLLPIYYQTNMRFRGNR